MTLYINGKEVLSNIVMHGTWTASGTVTMPAVTLGGVVTGADDTIFGIGAGNDGVLYLNSAGLAANTALAGVLIGTPVTPALAANSLIVSNITASGDILFAVNTGGHSQGLIFLDGSAGTVNFPLGIKIPNAAGDAYVTLDSGDDTVAGNKGLAFYAAADEDIEIFNLTNTTGTPRVYWDESANAIAYWGNMILGAGEGGVTLVNDAVIRPPNLASGAGDDNVAGADFYIQGALGRGTGDVGQIIFQTAQPAAADTVQTYATILTLDQNLATFSQSVTIGTLNGTTVYVASSIQGGAADIAIQPQTSNNSYIEFRGRITDGAQVAVGRVVSAADPYFGLGATATALKVTNANLVGFFAATPVGQQNIPLTAPATQDIVDALIALGLVEQSDS